MDENTTKIKQIQSDALQQNLLELTTEMEVADDECAQNLTKTNTSNNSNNSINGNETNEPTTTTLATQLMPMSSAKTLKRCLSVPIIHTVQGIPVKTNACQPASTITTRSAAAAAAASAKLKTGEQQQLQETPKKYQHTLPDSSTGSNAANSNIFANHIRIPRSNPSSREVSPAPVFNIFGPRTRRYSASYSPLNVVTSGQQGGSGSNGAPLCLTPRVSQLRQEECIDMNSREVNHEREVHSAMQMSQSWEDLTLVAENWSCKSDEFSNPLQVALPTGVNSCSSPSPTSNRAGLRLPYGLSPSPTRRTFATRRSMSPIAMRPSQLGPVKRKFELEENNSSNWNVYSPPPLKKIFTESRGSSPVCQSPSSICPSPDSGTYDGRITPKLFISKLCTTNTNNSACSSPMSASPSSSIGGSIDAAATSNICSSTTSSSSSSSSSSSGSSLSGNSEPMMSIDEGISMTENDDLLKADSSSNKKDVSSSCNTQLATMATDMQDEMTLMDDMKSETSSIGGCSSISIESTSCDSGAAKATGNFFNKFSMDEAVNQMPPAIVGQKNFFINKQGPTGAKKFIVNHNDNLPSSSSTTELPVRAVTVPAANVSAELGLQQKI